MQQLRYERLATFLESHFGYAEIYLPDLDTKGDMKPGEKDDPAIIVKVDGIVARVNLVNLVRQVSIRQEYLMVGYRQ